MAYNNVRWYVKNELGCILAGCVTREQAEEKKAEWERRYRENPFGAQDMRVYIVERSKR